MATKDEQYAFWRAGLTGHPLPAHEGDPQPGFYRRRAKTGTDDAVAYWVDGSNTMQCVLNRSNVGIEMGINLWTHVCDKPVTHQDYMARIENGAWPNENAVLLGMERWLPFEDTEYEVSDRGNVRNAKGVTLTPRVHTHGYHRVSLGETREEYVHRMVLLAFVGPQPEGHEADHRNANRADNRLQNLRWLSKAENLAQRVHPNGESNHAAKLTEQMVRIIRSGEEYSGRDNDLAIAFGVSRESIRDARLGKTWRHSIGGNVPPQDDSMEALNEALNSLQAEAERIIKGGPAKTQAEADQASDLANGFMEIEKKAATLHKVEKAPILAAGKEVDKKWFAIRDDAQEYKERLRLRVVTPYLSMLRRMAEEANRKAVEAGEAPVEARIAAGSLKRTTALRKVVSAQINDYPAALSHFASNPEVRDLVQRLADRAIRAGSSVPGCARIETETAV